MKPVYVSPMVFLVICGVWALSPGFVEASYYIYDYQLPYYQRHSYYTPVATYYQPVYRYPSYPSYPSYPQYPQQPQYPQYPQYPQQPQYPQYPHYPPQTPINQRPSITGFEGPTTLTVNQVGTWTLRATDPEGGYLSYSIDWGDNIPGMYSSQTSIASQFTQQTSITHSYATAGTFTVTITVRDNAGLTAETRSTVYVSNVINNPQHFQVISPNGGEIWRRGTQQQITWTPPTVTYPYNPGHVRINLQGQCPAGSYCTAIWLPTYTIQQSALNSGSAIWTVGTAYRDNDTTPVAVPAGTYLVNVCRYDYNNNPTVCDTSNAPFTLTD